MRRLIFAACLAGAPLLTSAQSMIYKVQMPDGSVLYSDSVPSGGKVLEEREVKSTPRVNTVPGLAPGRAAPRATRSANPSDPMTGSAAPSKGGTTPDNIPALERELTIAKRKLELGREPLPGERRGLAGGGSRLTPEYEARIAGMERDIASIEAKLKSAYEKR
jgi:hypothetical protein